MIVHVVHDAHGKIISIGVPARLSADFRGPDGGPTARPGQHVGEYEVPAAHSRLRLHELADKLQVDVKGGKLMTKP
jgi:hypothetical protein